MKSQLTPQELKVVELKYQSKQIGNMDESELSMWGKALLMKIHVITGWTIPNSPELLNILIDQFNKYLSEKYFALNTDEMEYAFRQHGTIIEDWGKAMNLNLLDKVLIPYINQRLLVSEVEEKLKNVPPPQKIFTQDELDDSQREDAELQYQRFLKGMDLKGVEICKAILLKDNLIKEDESVIGFFKRRVEKGSSNIYIKHQ